MNNFKYGNGSNKKLETCHPILKHIAELALQRSPYDITIIYGWRGMDLQNRLYEKNTSTKKFPDSRHNKTNDVSIIKSEILSDALDFAPYIKGTIYWDDIMIFAVIAGCLMSAANELGYTLRWGGDWNSDGQTTDQTLLDWGHIEIMWSTV